MIELLRLASSSRGDVPVSNQVLSSGCLLTVDPQDEKHWDGKRQMSLPDSTVDQVR